MLTKTEIMDLVMSGRAHESFTHSTEGEFDITVMRAAARAGLYERFRAELSSSLIESIKLTRDYDTARVLAITPQQMNEPTLWVLTQTDEHLLIDGTHRLLARATAGFTHFKGYLATMDKIIRPDMNQFYHNSAIDWGRIERRTDGKLYDRITGEEF